MSDYSLRGLISKFLQFAAVRTPETEVGGLPRISSSLWNNCEVIERAATIRLLQLLGEFPAVALLGPRQVGKTTLALSLTNEAENSPYTSIWSFRLIAQSLPTRNSTFPIMKIGS